MNPKETFQKSPASKGFTELIDSVQIQAALDAATLQFQSGFMPAPDMATAAANEWRRQGANQFRSIFERLGLPPEQKQKRIREFENLDHTQ